MAAADVGLGHSDQREAQVGPDEIRAEQVGDPSQACDPVGTFPALSQVGVQLGIADGTLLAVEPGRERTAPELGVGAADQHHGLSLTASVGPMNHRRPARSVSERAVSDARITARALEARAGDRPALGEFIRLTQSDVWCFIAHLAGREMADDLTQETYLRAMDALPQFRGEATARSWLLTIARRVAADHFRSQATRPPEASADSADRLTVPDASTRVELERMLASLDPVRREALVLTQVFGFSYAEAAGIAGVAVGTIRSRVARARAELVDHWSDATLIDRRGPLAG